MKPETVKETTEGGLPIRDLFAFAGVRRIIGDPTGKLMQDEVADRIEKLVNVLQNIVGLVDALDRLSGRPRFCRELGREVRDDRVAQRGLVGRRR